MGEDDEDFDQITEGREDQVSNDQLTPEEEAFVLGYETSEDEDFKGREKDTEDSYEKAFEEKSGSKQKKEVPVLRKKEMKKPAKQPKPAKKPAAKAKPTPAKKAKSKEKKPAAKAKPKPAKMQKKEAAKKGAKKKPGLAGTMKSLFKKKKK